MDTQTYSPALPAEGFDLSSLVVEGNGKDHDLLLRRDGRPTLAIPLNGIRIAAADNVVLDVLPQGDTELSLVYSTPGLRLTGARFSWEDNEFRSGIHEEIESEFGILFGDAPCSDGRRRELRCCIHAEVALNAVSAPGGIDLSRTQYEVSKD